MLKRSVICFGLLTLLVGCGDDPVVKTTVEKTATSVKVVCYDADDDVVSEQACGEYLKANPANVQQEQQAQPAPPVSNQEQVQGNEQAYQQEQQQMQYSDSGMQQQPVQTVVQQVPVQQQPIVVQSGHSGLADAIVAGAAINAISNMGNNNRGYDDGYRNNGGNRTVVNKTIINKNYNTARPAPPVQKNNANMFAKPNPSKYATRNFVKPTQYKAQPAPRKSYGSAFKKRK